MIGICKHDHRSATSSPGGSFTCQHIKKEGGRERGGRIFSEFEYLNDKIRNLRVRQDPSYCDQLADTRKVCASRWGDIFKHGVSQPL